MKISYQIKDNYLLFSYINKKPKDLIEGNFYREGAIKYTKKYLKSIENDEWAYKNGECIISIGVDSNSNNIEVLVDAFYNPHTGDFEIKNIDMVYTNVSVVEEIHTKEQLDLFMENNEISNFIPLVYDEKDLLKFYQLLFYKLLE